MLVCCTTKVNCYRAYISEGKVTNVSHVLMEVEIKLVIFFT